jgi:uncharacterized hydrophobic protein (TIGR00271 family)
MTERDEGGNEHSGSSAGKVPSTAPDEESPTPHEKVPTQSPRKKLSFGAATKGVRDRPLGFLAKVIGQGRRNSLDELEDSLYTNVGQIAAKQSRFWALMVLSSLIAAGGVISDSTPAVIGAMIIAPLATPIYGVAFATTVGSAKGLRGAAIQLVTRIGVNNLIAFLAGVFFITDSAPEANPQIVGRTSPSMLDLVIAVTTGLAGGFALVRRDISNILGGVAIAISLVPVLAVVGITLAYGRFEMAGGALLLFLTNVAAILVAGVAVFTAGGYNREAVAEDHRIRRRARILLPLFLVVLVVPLGYTSFRTARYNQWTDHSRQATQSWLEDSATRIDDVEVVGSDIFIRVIGPGDAPSLGQLRERIRQKVPDRVDVWIIEDSGETYKL